MAIDLLGNGAPLALDLIVVALTVLLPVLAASIVAIRRGQRRLHRSLQIAITVALVVSLLLFEFQIRNLGGWRESIADRNLSESQLSAITAMLIVHLIFSVTTPAFWLAALISSTKAWTGRRPQVHHWLGRLAALDLVLTAITGWVWYAMAYVN